MSPAMHNTVSCSDFRVQKLLSPPGARTFDFLIQMYPRRFSYSDRKWTLSSKWTKDMPDIGRSGSNGSLGDFFGEPLRALGTVGANRREGGVGSSTDSASDSDTVSP